MQSKKLPLLTTFACAALAMSLMIPACRDRSDDADTSSNTGGTSTASLPAGLFLAAAPAGPVTVQQLKTQVQAGDEVVMRVVVGGEVNVFVPGRAIVKVIDTEMENLCLKPGDSCKTPWDYCCATAEDLQRHRATVKVVDAQGKTLRVDLKGAGEIEEMKTLVVRGVVAQGSDEKNLVVNAQGIYVEN
jgi:hypothetical protein